MLFSAIPQSTPTVADAKPVIKKKRNWLFIVIIIVCIVVVNGAIQMWREANQVNQLSRQLPGISAEQRESPAKRIFNTVTGCSFILPRNWEPLERPNKPVAYIGPTLKQSTPSLHMQKEAFPGTFDEYVQASLQQMRMVFKQFELLEEATFTTDQGQVGKRAIIQFQGTTHRLKQHFYFLPHSEKEAYIMCGSMSEVFGDSLTPLFDTTARSVQFNKDKDPR